MKCQQCGKKMKFVKDIDFNGYKIDGWRCCEIFFHPEQAQRVLLLNKLKKQKMRAKLGRIRSNLILRLPKDVEDALGFQQGEDVLLEIKRDGLRVSKA